MLNKFYLITCISLICLIGSSCRFQTIETVPLESAVKKVTPVYNKYRDCFFKIFMDEDKNRFNGFTAEWVVGEREKFEKEPFNLLYDEAKFGDGNVYCGLTLTFLSFDYGIQISNQNKKEASRTLKMIERVINGIIKSDQLSLQGSNGFLYRDIVGEVKGIKVRSDFLNKKITDKYMSQSQIVGLLIGYSTFNKVIKDLNLNSQKINELKKKLDQQIKLIAQYLKRNHFVIKSEVNNKIKVPRGPYAKIISKKVFQLYNFYSGDENKFPFGIKEKLYWSIGSRGYNSFYNLTNDKRSYYEKNLTKGIQTSGKTWGPFFHQLLCQYPFTDKRTFQKTEPQWKKWVERYRNSLAVAMALANFSVVDEQLKQMVYDDLMAIPTYRTPDNFHADHKGWVHENRWIRLLSLNTHVGKSERIVRVYNGLDFLMLYGATKYSQIIYRKSNE
ncbi:MAG: hypothetical protein COA79_19685 [Planctomycetota bacterium]|nr:MAG: hypothetical protein COA79_19685 [Planctomycetota bacterium]